MRTLRDRYVAVIPVDGWDLDEKVRVLECAHKQAAGVVNLKCPCYGIACYMVFDVMLFVQLKHLQ